ncbi:MAG TPA: gfo/Idh/MocA family oxidoreductase [Rhodospirillaceae bacterium]|nr:gfo/Idh/MocA family oxidoreductase [Rhodospirillaceae bacterium]
MREKIKVAAVGLGWVAQNRHIPALLRNPAFELVGLIDRHKRKAAALAKRYNLPFSAEAEDVGDVPWIDECDAITIGAPPMAHAKLAIKALERGKHVLTEKPFAITLDEGRAMAQAAQDNERTLAVVHNFQFSRAMRRFEADREKNKLGDIKQIAATQLGNPARRLPSWYEDLPLGLFFDESPHFFYLLQRLAGKIELQRAHAVASPEGKETPSLIHLLYRSEQSIPVTINCQFDSALSEWFIRISGEKATAFLDIFRDIYICVPNDQTHSALDILRTSASTITQHLLCHLPNGLNFVRGRLDYGNDDVFARFAEAILSNKTPDRINFEAALSVLQCQQEATQALRKNSI